MTAIRLKALVEEVLKAIPQPYTEDLIEDVFVAIDGNERWKKEYEALKYNLHKSVANAWIGFWVANLTGRIAGEQVSASRASLIESYAKLAKRPRVAARKVKEPEALKAMSEYFFANKETLPPAIRENRGLILELIKAGFDVADAFAKSLEKPAHAR